MVLSFEIYPLSTASQKKSSEAQCKHEGNVEMSIFGGRFGVASSMAWEPRKRERESGV